uniref:Uncharacterized protein n=1 Tax=Chromera velia CCMP2878 TaxID=1169474 RepID=A0A0G4I8A1_9ALVE|eukprot:Cvel_11880.t1-p1 / transcript=Cvel_11880.t1 / gene=Cvel_11880 / organism=Chromera_velia_CCMP2878 / gene_product=hypothetical protein / transcript_product=hypothetical protein / location=Cvel_scaffold759:20400-21609(+) / protein_length=370 / sequence_SO=supercontig / SO=protein_coding / is_pseudo=false
MMIPCEPFDEGALTVHNFNGIKKESGDVLVSYTSKGQLKSVEEMTRNLKGVRIIQSIQPADRYEGWSDRFYPTSYGRSAIPSTVYYLEFKEVWDSGTGASLLVDAFIKWAFDPEHGTFPFFSPRYDMYEGNWGRFKKKTERSLQSSRDLLSVSLSGLGKLMDACDYDMDKVDRALKRAVRFEGHYEEARKEKEEEIPEGEHREEQRERTQAAAAAAATNSRSLRRQRDRDLEHRVRSPSFSRPDDREVVIQVDQEAGDETPSKRQRTRDKEEKQERRGRSRPPGSKNKTKEDQRAEAAERLTDPLRPGTSRQMIAWAEQKGLSTDDDEMNGRLIDFLRRGGMKTTTIPMVIAKKELLQMVAFIISFPHSE